MTARNTVGDDNGYGEINQPHVASIDKGFLIAGGLQAGDGVAQLTLLVELGYRASICTKWSNPVVFGDGLAGEINRQNSGVGRF